MRRHLGGAYTKRFVFTEHHEAHAASAFFPSPFEEAAILTLDGVGEWDTASWGVGRGHRIELQRTLSFPHSLGLLYSAFTYYCGFRVNSGEYTLMGLAPYGEPEYAHLIRAHLIDTRDDGSFALDLSYFDYCWGLRMTSKRFHDLFGGPPRSPESEVTQRDMNLAASIQLVTEEIVLRMARHLHEQTGLRQLVMAGGVALNCVANGRIVREGPFEELWVQPAAGDAGGALGVALFTWHQLLEQPRSRVQARAPEAQSIPALPSTVTEASSAIAGRDAQFGSLLGPSYSTETVVRDLDALGAVYSVHLDEMALLVQVAELLAAGKVVGWFQGRAEFGPRALGARSILGDPRAADMQTTMNVKIKFRESFRPFAPAVLRERATEYFDLPEGTDSPYMLLVAPVSASKRLEVDTVDTVTTVATGLERLKQRRSEIPAVTHVDGSARVQTVDRERNPRFHALLEAFDQLTGCPVLVNTSFNVRGEPIVHSPADAYRCFRATGMDVLVIENCLLEARDQPESGDRDRYYELLPPD